MQAHSCPPAPNAAHSLRPESVLPCGCVRLCVWKCWKFLQDHRMDLLSRGSAFILTKSLTILSCSDPYSTFLSLNIHWAPVPPPLCHIATHHPYMNPGLARPITWLFPCTFCRSSSWWSWITSLSVCCLPPWFQPLFIWWLPGACNESAIGSSWFLKHILWRQWWTHTFDLLSPLFLNLNYSARNYICLPGLMCVSTFFCKGFFMRSALFTADRLVTVWTTDFANKKHGYSALFMCLSKIVWKRFNILKYLEP